jgi:HEAT repeat protein
MLRPALIALLGLPGAAHAGPALRPIAANEIGAVQVSSTSEAREGGVPVFQRRQLMDGRDWSPWGSRADDVKGAWIRVDFDRVEYVAQLELVAGNARDGSSFRTCARPARVRLEMGGETRELEVRDKRYTQTVEVPSPPAGRSARLVVEQVYGEAGAAGVCLSELKLLAPSDPLAARPDLAARVQSAIDLLADDNHAERGQRVLATIGPPALPRLLASLDERNPNLTGRIAAALGELGDRSAIPTLAKLAQSHFPEVRESALWALGALRDTDHYDAIRAWYDHSDGHGRDRAFDALARLGDPRALDAVVAELVDGSASRRESAEHSLGGFGADGIQALRPLLSSDVPRERAAALRALGTLDLPEAREQLLAGLTHADVDIRTAALTGLAHRGDSSIRDLVGDRWQSRYASERAAAAAALGACGDPRDVETLDLLTADTAMSVRVAAAGALGRYGAEARPLLVRLAVDGPDGATARAAAEALLAEDLATSEIVRVLGSRHEEVRKLAGDAIAERGGDGRAALLAALVGSEDRVRSGVAPELAALGPMIVPEILRVAGGASPGAQVDVLHLLGKIGDARAVPYAARLARDGADLTIRRVAVQTLAACGDAASVAPTLVAALDDAAVEVRQSAVEAAGQLRVKAALPGLLPMLDSDQDALRRAAVVALGRIRSADALQALASRYQSAVQQNDTAALREDLIVAIGRIGGDASIPVLVQAMSDEDDHVRAAAETALH